MRVKCISDKDSFLIECRNITVGKEYEVIGVSEDYSLGTNVYTIADDNGLYFSHGISIFRLIEEDKMEEIRVVRKLEDLDGLENSKGWKLSFESTDNFKDKGYYQEWVRLDDKSDKGWFNAFYELTDKTINLLRVGGFKFEYKPQRIVHEVIKEIKSLESLEFKQGELNYFVSSYRDKYYVEAMRETFIIGVNYMTKEQAQKYADELNEIIRVGK